MTGRRPTARTRARLAQARAYLDAAPPEGVPGQLDLAGREAKPKVCEYGNPQCKATPARHYPCGWKCDEHQPARTSRRPEARA